MAVKSFIRGDFRTLIVDNDYPTNYKVYYNGKWNLLLNAIRSSIRNK